ncbi:major facilitator superfamily transporter [Nocardia nova SH22a]|uniref:Major facilitator superfamily transporter n=1 Tax=Nocardia nova SH22a TaxID=1415166 RepID=W5TWN5_9NOCA|nr:MFS transporter [Nocardia nova]AHH21601.1 major facilitator superfamily transporter [Nocardia nova SH22a]
MADHARTDAEPDSEAGTPTPYASRRALTAVLALAVAMVTLDGTIVAVSLPSIIGDVGIDFTQAQWVLCVYPLVIAVLLIVMGRIGDRFGRRLTIAVGALVFLVGSILAASADTSGPLVWGRIVQGVGAAAVLAGSLAVIVTVFRGRERAVAFTAWGIALAFGAVAGALLGGWFTHSFTWPWIFLINVPIAVVVLFGCRAVPESKVGAAASGLDVDGWLLATAGFALTVFALIEAQRYGWGTPKLQFTVLGWKWSMRSATSPLPLILVSGVFLLVLFVFWERHRVKVEHSALVDFSRLREPRQWGDAAMFLVAFAQFGLLFVLPLYLVNSLGLSTLRSAFVIAALTGGALVAGLVSLGPARPLHPVWRVRFGLAIALITIAVTAFAITATISAWVPGILLTCYGIGIGLATPPLTGRLSAAAPRSASDAASVTALTARYAGAALGVAVLGGTLSIALDHFLPDRLDTVRGLVPGAADAVVDATRDSAGGAIGGLRAGHAPVAVTDVLAAGFADATRVALLGAVVALLLAFIAATRIPLEPRRDEAGTSPVSR